MEKKLSDRQTLKAGEVTIRYLTENMADILWAMDLNFQTLYVSPAIEPILGFTPEECKKQKLDGMVTPKSLKRVRRIFAKEIIREKIKRRDPDRSFTVEIEYYKKDGTTIQLENKIKWLRNEKGKIIGIHGVARDTTDRKKTEEALKESEDFYQAVFEQAADSVILVSAEDGSIVDFNDKAYENLGYTRDEFAQLLISDLEVIESAEEIKKHMDKIIRQGSDKWETKHRTKTGELRNIAIKSRAISIEGRTFFVTVWHDITEEKKAAERIKREEEKYRILFETSRDAIMTLNPPSWLFTSGNQSTVEIFNCKDEKDFVSYAPFELSPAYQPDGKTSKEKALEMINKAMKEGSNFFEWRHKKVDGEEFPATVLLTKVELEKGKPFLQATVRDITKEKRVQEEKRRLQEQLKIYARQLEMKVKKLETQGVSLRRRERAVLTAMTCCPRFNDQKYAEMTKLKRSTVTAIRNRLKKDGWYKVINLPNLKVLGFEVLSFYYLSNFEKLDKNLARDMIKSSPDCVYAELNDNFGYVINVQSSIATAHQAAQKVLTNKEFKELVGEIKHTEFILPVTEMVNFFCYANILNKKFDLEFKPAGEEVKSKESFLSKNEKILLYTLTKFPKENNQKLQEITRFSKPTIIKIRKKLFDQGYLRKMVIPNTKKLGLDHGSFIYQKLNKPLFDKKHLFAHLTKESRNTFMALIDDEKFLNLAVHEDYQQLEDSLLKKKNLYQKMFKTLDSPEVYTFQNPQIIKLDFSELVKKAFDLKINY